MNNSIEYAKMIEIPSSSTEFSIKKKSNIFSKKDIMNKVNSKTAEKGPKKSFFDVIFKKNKKQNIIENENDSINNDTFCCDCNEKNDCSSNLSCLDCNNSTCLKNDSIDSENTSTKNKKCGKKYKNCTDLAIYDKNTEKKEKRKNLFIKFQVAAAFCLAVAIVLTNIFWENSGMNTLFKGIFGLDGQKEVVDTRKPEDFSLTLPASKDSVTIDKGVITIKGEYSLYPVAEGVVKTIDKNPDGTFTITINHSDNFSSVVSGVDLVYFDKGDEVFQNVPLGWSQKEAQVYLYSDNNLVTDYATVENTIVFDK